MKPTHFLLLLICCLSCKTQVDSYEGQSETFAEAIVNNTDINDLKLLVNDSVYNHGLVDSIKLAREFIGDRRENLELYIMKVNRPIPIYNVNLYDKKAGKEYGDVRIVFKNEEDYLIDHWRYLHPEEPNNEYVSPTDIPPPPPRRN